MPSIIGEPCALCDEGEVVSCEPGECVRCDRCEFHDYALVENNTDIPFEDPFQSPETARNLREIQLPAGLLWNRYPEPYIADQSHMRGAVYFRRQPQDFVEAITEARAWAEREGLWLYPMQTQAVVSGNGGYQTRPNVFWLAETPAPEGSIVYSVLKWEDEFTCPLCENTHPAYTERCPELDEWLMCQRCLFNRGDIRDADGSGQLICPSCIRECPADGCSRIVYDSEFCDDHGQTAECNRCGYFIEIHVDEEFNVDADGSILCDECHSRCCAECGRFTRRNLQPNLDGLWVCRRCFLGADDAEVFDEDADRELHIPAIPGRENIRLCGVEIEGGDGSGDGRDLAQAFYNEGLSEWDNIGGYHSGSEGGFAHVERDSSVDWEAVIGPVNMALPEDTEALNMAVRQIRSLVHDGTLTLDLRAGCHIHVEAARTSLDGAYNLNLLFAFMEDVIFRLGAARWPVHRAVQDTHYTQPIPKELRKVQFAREHAEGDNSRYYALSFNNYFQQMLGRCRCGATRYDSWEDCTCSLGKCTFEFRVFNTTANPRKLHAYLALCQALVAKAMSLGRIDGDGMELFPALAFVSRRFKDMDEIDQESLVESWKERLTWMFTELPLTEDEKESLAYCIQHSELESVGADFINELLAQQVITEVTA